MEEKKNKKKVDKKRLEITSLLILIVSAILFILILINLNNPYISSLDKLINSKIQKIQDNTLTFLTTKISNVFEPKNGIILLIIISLILWVKGFKKQSFFLAFASIIGAGFIYSLKSFIERTRPLNSIIQETGFSFPSGHATMALILFGCLTYYAIKYLKSESSRIIAISFSIFFILLIGFSRIYLRVHWFSDVIAGFLLGIFVIILTRILQGAIKK